MTERPIPFSGPMVRAILEGRKTQTRRVVKPQPPSHVTGIHQLQQATTTGSIPLGSWQWLKEDEPAGVNGVRCPYGVPGDRLWVREACAVHKVYDKRPLGELSMDRVERVWYCCDYDDYRPAPFGRYRHGRFMPRWACRLVLEVTAVRVERLQDISEADAIAEGIKQWTGGRWKCAEADGLAHESAADAYCCLWDSLNAKRAAWASNPWVWVVSFKRA